MTLDEAKQKISKKYGKSSWELINRDFEFGIGISKIISYEDLMGKVAEILAESRSKKYLKTLKLILKLSEYNKDHDKMLYAVQNIHELVKETLHHY
jgi:hypothetical protein